MSASFHNTSSSYRDERDMPAPTSTIDRIDCTLNNVADHLRSLHERFDRLLGAGMEKEGTVNPVPNGTLEVLEQKLNSLEHSASRLLDRIGPHFA